MRRHVWGGVCDSVAGVKVSWFTRRSGKSLAGLGEKGGKKVQMGEMKPKVAAHANESMSREKG